MKSIRRMWRFASVVMFASAAASGCSTSANATDFAIDAENMPVVVVASDASAGVKYAAKELSEHLEKMFGVRPETVVVDGERPRRAIFLGRTGFERDPMPSGESFRLKTRDGDLYVLGTDRGVLYGVYEFLERYCGCEWFTHDQSIVPRRKSLRLPDGLDDAQSPAFEIRQTSWHDFVKYPEFAARLKVNYGSKWDGDPRFGPYKKLFVNGLGACHTFRWLVPVDKWYDAHPEYFSLVKGKRLKERTQLCLTNPDVLEIAWQTIEERLAADPGAKVVGVSQNDWRNWCECDNCRKVIEEEGGAASATAIRFVNQIAKRLAEKHPGVRVHTEAYHYTKEPPKFTKLEPNVMITFSTTECDYRKPMLENPRSGNRDSVRQLKTWRAQCDKVHLWNYSTDFWAYPFPMPNVYASAADIRFYRDKGVFFLYEQGCRQGPHAWFGELKGWLYAHLMWNPDQPLEPLLRRFFNGFYGAAADKMREYLDKATALEYDVEKYPLNYSRRVVTPAVPNGFFDESDVLLHEAMELVRDDKVRRRNVQWAIWANDYARVMRWIWDAPNREPERYEEMKRLAARVVAMREREKPVQPVFAECKRFDENHMFLLRELANSKKPDDGPWRPSDPKRVKALDD